MGLSRWNGVLVALSAALVLGVAGCGGEGGQAPGGSGSASGTGSGSGSAAGSGSVPQGVAAQYATLEEEIAAEGGATVSGPWRVAYIVEPAEPWFRPPAQGLTFRKPAPGETHHIEIIPFEAGTGRVVPYVPIRLEVVSQDGRVVDAKQLSFYYSEFFHYANNFSVPRAGSYTLRATLGAPTFRRHGERSAGPALTEGTTVEFTEVELRPQG